MSNLYELTADWEQVFSMLEDPDIPEDAIWDSIEGIEAVMDVKAESMAKILKTMDGDVAKIDAEINRLQERKKSMKNRQNWFKSALENMMRTTGRLKFKTPLFSFHIQKNGGSAPVILDPSVQVPAEWLKPGDPDTKKIREYLESGGVLGFASLGSRGESLRIR